MSDFDDRSGVIRCRTAWGSWYQTIDEVVVELEAPEGIRSKEIACSFSPSKLSCKIRGDVVINGKLFNTVIADEALWTLEDKKLIRVVLTKSDKTAANCWKSLLIDQYMADPLTLDQMQKKLTLQRFQIENPGFDFSNADMSGNYEDGGPKFNT